MRTRGHRWAQYRHMDKLAVIGDIGGHEMALREALIVLGADPDEGKLPAGLTVVQVGDLIHRGPDSDAVVRLVDRFYKNSPDNWIQLAGNHETCYFKDPVFKWPRQVSDEEAEILANWWKSGWMRTSWAGNTVGQSVRLKGGQRVEAGAGDLLITHAGLTSGLWKALGSPTSAAEAADAIEEDARSRPADYWTGAWAPGIMLSRMVNLGAGVVWASAPEELIPSWALFASKGEELPLFSQAHGHSTVFSWRDGGYYQPLDRMRDGNIPRYADTTARQTRVSVGDMVFFGTDPGHGVRAVGAWAPLVLEQTK